MAAILNVEIFKNNNLIWSLFQQLQKVKQYYKERIILIHYSYTFFHYIIYNLHYYILHNKNIILIIEMKKKTEFNVKFMIKVYRRERK